jgi:hypothetical protein
VNALWLVFAAMTLIPAAVLGETNLLGHEIRHVKRTRRGSS